MAGDSEQRFYEKVEQRMRAAGVFAEVRRTKDAVRGDAEEAASEAFYQARVDPAGEKVWVGLYSPDRWLSESIEAELMFRGDKLEELLEEELVDQGYDAGGLSVEHFRDENKLYTFRSLVSPPTNAHLDDDAMADRVASVLLAYAACFSELGDMSPSDESN